MKLGLKPFIQEVILILRKIADQDHYIRALIQTANNKPQGFLSLATIYEQGSSVMSADAAIAYAMYCLGANQQMRNVNEKIRTLKSHLMIKDKVRANRIIQNFKQEHYFNASSEVTHESMEEFDMIGQYVS